MEGRPIARFLFNDPLALRAALEQLAEQPAATRGERLRAVFQDGLLRIVAPGRSARETRSIKFETAGTAKDATRIVIKKPGPEVVDAVKGADYQELPPKPARRRRSGS